MSRTTSTRVAGVLGAVAALGITTLALAPASSAAATPAPVITPSTYEAHPGDVIEMGTSFDWTTPVAGTATESSYEFTAPAGTSFEHVPTIQTPGGPGSCEIVSPQKVTCTFDGPWDVPVEGAEPVIILIPITIGNDVESNTTLTPTVTARSTIKGDGYTKKHVSFDQTAATINVMPVVDTPIIAPAAAAIGALAAAGIGAVAVARRKRSTR